MRLTGMVVANQPATVNVNFSGTVSGSTTPNATGYFSFTTGTASLGTVYAVGIDQQQQSSNTAQSSVAVAPPTLTLNITYMTQRTVTLSGTVSSIDAGGRTVTFSGVATGSAVTTSNGMFSYTTQASALGNIQAVTTDLWGQTSSSVQVTVASNDPSITNFAAVHGIGTVWTFQGRVIDESASGLTITFAGIPSLANRTTTVGQDGWFYLTIELQEGEEGVVTAETIDWWGLESNEAQTTVFI
ncbi:MAG: hypothetical protein FJ271_15525 [Planctomycetes bacterium]|nr:hypothetical protein [Planctomycetota bacterium]